MTVAMPCYNGKKIGWLSMESLCRQENVNFHWELIVCEEEHINMLGMDFFNRYKDRLAKVGCVSVKYLALKEWVNLPTKWKVIGKEMHQNSKIFVLKAVDCYSQPNRLRETHDQFKEKDLDWLDYDKGYFYSFEHDKTIMYNGGAKTNLDMAMNARHARRLPMMQRNKGIDGAIYNFIKTRCKVMKKFTIKGNRGAGVDTDGYNNISKKRVSFYDSIRCPFVASDKQIEEILPSDIVERIKKMG